MPTGEHPIAQSHFLPRTRAGRVAVLSFLGLFLLVEPPVLYSVANRIEPFLFGLPFLYVYLLTVYIALIGVLVWVQRRGL